MKNIVKAIISKDKKYLLIKRNEGSKFFPNLWDFPGGKLKKDEDLLYGLKREVFEETALKIIPNELVREINIEEQGEKIYFRVFSIKSFDGNVKLSEDHSDFIWIEKNELNKYKLTPVVDIYFGEEEISQIIKDVGFDFDWSEEKVWDLNVPTEEMNINELTWHFDIPFLWEEGVYNLKPQDVINDPENHKEEYERTMKADLSYPIDIMENKGRWLILDGLHRLMKASILKMNKVQVRKISREYIPNILS